MGVCWVPSAEIPVFVRACFQDIFCTDFELKSGRVGVSKPGFLIEGIAKAIFPQQLFFRGSVVVFLRFGEASGTVFLIFVAPETGLKIDGIPWLNQTLS